MKCEQLEMKNNSIFWGTPLFKAQKMRRYPKNLSGAWPLEPPWLCLWLHMEVRLE